MQLSKDNYKDVNFCLRCGHKLELKQDSEAKVRPKCPNCNWTYYKNPVPASACVIFNEKEEILLIKRKIPPNKGEWALPSGYIEIYQTPEEAAIDEMEEETGLVGTVEEYLGFFNDNSPIYEKVLSLGFLMKIIDGKVKASDDADKAEYFPISEHPQICFPSHRFFIKQALKMRNKLNN